MPVYLFTWHAYRSWMPDRPEGYVVRGRGLLPADVAMAEEYAARAAEDEVTFEPAVQRTVIESLLDCREPLDVRLHAVATSRSHVHVLTSWRSERTWESTVRSLRRSVTCGLNDTYERREWISEGRSRKRVEEESHFEHLVGTYLPRHRGWFWSEKTGWREPQGIDEPPR